ncbi:MAG: hypothetical protein Q9187_003256 [Circinaria calcarea]
MECLEDKIHRLRQENVECRYFIPYRAINELITAESVRDTLASSGIGIQYLDELVQSIIKGACGIFAILLLIGQRKYISDFVRNDQFADSHSQLDSKIPFSLGELEKILPGPVAIRFDEKQWELAAPVFLKRVIPRSLGQRTILPILKETCIGEGGFGVIYEITLHNAHQKFSPTSGEMFVRKEFLPQSSKEDYENELHNLSLLNHLNDPNIIRLLSSYTYRGKHNLIFPRVSRGDLNALLAGERPPEFESSVTFVVALSNLASAIEKVHNFTAQTIGLEKIGCHHDLKPRNILVDGSRFILADFGLSRFKNSSQSSKTLHRKGQGDYLAPECEDLGENFEKYAISRSSDMWSFGCIMAEVLTYMNQGSTGVAEFRNKRRYKVAQWTYYHFHNGPNQSNPAVAQWLSSLDGDTTEMRPRSLKLMILLIKSMLSIRPDDRPTAAEVTSHLRFIVLDSVAQIVSDLYGETSGRSQSTQNFIEAKRFESWKWACGLSVHESHLNLATQEVVPDYEPTLDTLFQLRQELETIVASGQPITERMFASIRHFHNCLTGLLPGRGRERMQTHLECSLLEIQDPSILQEECQCFSEENVGLLASVRLMTILASEKLDANLRIELDDVDCVDSISGFDVGYRKKTKNGEAPQILVEWMRYHTSVIAEKRGLERLVRIQAIAKNFNVSEKLEDFRVLHCAAYFHDPSNTRFGLVFDFPRSSSSSAEHRLDFVTLRSLLDKPEKPVLGDRFKLAHALAVSVLKIHKVGWLHKNISSTNVAFFPPHGSSPVDSAKRPYIIGFSHSRPSEPFSETEGPLQGSDLRDYQHPDYLKNYLKFHAVFDYYSLGLTLLEIGLWRSISAMIKNRKLSPEEVRTHLLEKRVPRLKEYMGVRFSEVVKVCLTGDFGISHGSESIPHESIALRLNFERLVIEKLASCSV